MARIVWLLSVITLIAACSSGAQPTAGPATPAPPPTNPPATLAPETALPTALVVTPAPPVSTPSPVALTPEPSPGCTPGAAFRSNRSTGSSRSGSAGAGGLQCEFDPCELEEGFWEWLETYANDVLARCFPASHSPIIDPLGDQFAQDARPMDPSGGIRADLDYLDAITEVLRQAEAEELRQQCGTQDIVIVICDPDKKPEADVPPIIVFAHLPQPFDTTHKNSFGLDVRYDDTTPGRGPIDGYPFLISQGAHVEYLAPITEAGTYDPPVYTDYRTNSGAYSNHIQLIGPDFFAFIIYDNATNFRPWICQAGVDRPACDTTDLPQSQDWHALEIQ